MKHEKPHRDTVEVIATAKGYYGEKIREVGEKFFVADNQVGDWMEPVHGGDKERLAAAKSAGGTKVIARNGENVVTEGSTEKVKKAALKHADPGGEGKDEVM